MNRLISILLAAILIISTALFVCQAEEEDKPDLVQLLAAAEAGDAEAMNRLGVMYGNGDGVAKDPVMAMQWLEKAAAAGHAKAMLNLGVMYDWGRGIERDFAVAKVWYEKAAAAGQADAMYNLGTMYRDGRGVQQDHTMMM